MSGFNGGSSDPLRNGAIFRICQSPSQPTGLGNSGVDYVKMRFDDVFRRTPLPPNVHIQSSLSPGYTNSLPINMSPTSNVGFPSSSSINGATFPMSPPSLPSPRYFNNPDVQRTTSSTPASSINPSTQRPETPRLDRSLNPRTDMAANRSQSAPPVRSDNLATSTAVNIVNNTPAVIETSRRTVSQSRSRVASGGNTGLTGMFSSVLDSGITSNKNSGSGSNVNKISGGPRTASSSQSVRDGKGSSGRTGGGQNVMINALIGTPPATKSVASSGVRVANTGVGTHEANNVVTSVVGPDGKVIHSPPVKRKTPQPAFYSNVHNAPAVGAPVPASNRGPSQKSPGPSGTGTARESTDAILKQHLQLLQSRRSPFNASTSISGAIAALSASTEELPPAPHTVTRSGRPVTAPQRMKPEEPRTYSNSMAHSSEYVGSTQSFSTPSARPSSSSGAPGQQHNLVRHGSQQKALVAVKVSEDERFQNIRSYIYQETARMKGVKNWSEICENVNKKLKSGPPLTEEECRNYYTAMEEKRRLAMLNNKRKAESGSSLSALDHRNKDSQSVKVVSAGVAAPSVTNNRAATQKVVQQAHELDQQPPEKRKRLGAKAVKELAITASQSEQPDDIFEKIGDYSRAFIGEQVDSIKTPSAGGRNTTGRGLVNNDTDDDSEGEDDNNGYRRLATGKGGSPEITFDHRVAGKLRLPPKTFAVTKNSLEVQKKPVKKTVSKVNPNIIRRTTVSDDTFKGSVDPSTGLVHIVKHLSADSQSDLDEDDDETYSDDEDEGFTWI